VRALRRAGDDGHADDVGVELRGHVLDALVVELHVRLELGRNQRGERSQREWLIAKRLAEDAAAVAVERAFRGNQRYLHVSLGGPPASSPAGSQAFRLRWRDAAGPAAGTAAVHSATGLTSPRRAPRSICAVA